MGDVEEAEVVVLVFLVFLVFLFLVLLLLLLLLLLTTATPCASSRSAALRTPLHRGPTTACSGVATPPPSMTTC